MPRAAHTPAPSPGQAQYVLDRLIAERRITITEVQGYLRALEREILELEMRIRTLRDADDGSRLPIALPATPRTGVRRRRRHSAAGRRGLRFSGLIRRLPANAKKRLKAIRAEQGIEVAIAAAEAAGHR